MKVLVTGASGFLGGALARRAAADGHAVRGFVRDARRWSDPPPAAEIVVGDLSDPGALVRAAEGCDAVLHAAALVKMWVRDRREFDRVNVQGLGHVAAAARAAGARLVYVSSFLALGPSDGTVLDEQSRRSDAAFRNDYERTKWVGDQLARHLATTGLDVVRLYPGVAYGPGALSAGNHVVGMLLQHARGKLPGILGAGDLRLCLAFVDDVSAGAMRALERAAPGSAYILGGENRTVRELFEAFHAASGIAPPRRKIPFVLAGLVGRLQRWRARLLGIEPELTDEVVQIYRHEWAYSSARAERELGYQITPLVEGVRRTVAWLRESRRLT
ncbi:MAG TPA: NAD-dependent epimerase/dehydratase family protein [Candidatus Polarisedimenticolaceae bacterium]|nr:NAD-dependent epimerase/dehydratase family protein [Candidatus Polarisedimenticolaceae bacterium]